VGTAVEVDFSPEVDGEAKGRAHPHDRQLHQNEMQIHEFSKYGLLTSTNSVPRIRKSRQSCR